MKFKDALLITICTATLVIVAQQPAQARNCRPPVTRPSQIQQQSWRF